MSQLDAVNEMVAAIADQLSDADVALVEAVRGLADAVDNSPRSPGLWQQYLSALERLSGLAVVVEDDGQAEILQLLRSPLGDAETA